MDKVLFSLGEFPVTLEAAIYAVASLVTGLLVILVVMSIRAGRERAAEAEELSLIHISEPTRPY